MPWLRKTCRSMVWMRLEMVTTSMPPMRSTAVGPIAVSTPAFIGPSFLKLPSDSIFTMALALTGPPIDGSVWPPSTTSISAPTPALIACCTVPGSKIVPKATFSTLASISACSTGVVSL